MPTIVLRFNVDADPSRLDPHDVAEYLMALHDVEVRSGNATFEVATEFLEAEWED